MKFFVSQPVVRIRKDIEQYLVKYFENINMLNRILGKLAQRMKFHSQTKEKCLQDKRMPTGYRINDYRACDKYPRKQ